jgi:hypothetical protein
MTNCKKPLTEANITEDVPTDTDMDFEVFDNDLYYEYTNLPDEDDADNYDDNDDDDSHLYNDEEEYNNYEALANDYLQQIDVNNQSDSDEWSIPNYNNSDDDDDDYDNNYHTVLNRGLTQIAINNLPLVQTLYWNRNQTLSVLHLGAGELIYDMSEEDIDSDVDVETNPNDDTDTGVDYDDNNNQNNTDTNHDADDEFSETESVDSFNSDDDSFHQPSNKSSPTNSIATTPSYKSISDDNDSSSDLTDELVMNEYFPGMELKDGQYVDEVEILVNTPTTTSDDDNNDNKNNEEEDDDDHNLQLTNTENSKHVNMHTEDDVEDNTTRLTIEIVPITSSTQQKNQSTKSTQQKPDDPTNS